VGENPVTYFLHKGAEVGTVVQVEGGQGDFYYRRGMGDSLVLVAGGIGITPLMSIVRYIDEAEPDVSAALVYSASTPPELIFREELNEVARSNENIRCLFTVTRPGDEPWSGRVGRVDETMLREAGVDAGSLCYVSGPPSMIRDVVTLLRALGVPDPQIKYEWWE
jgi:ferredoxin-NADP reductase